jgi:hypothetical protein
MLDTRALVDSLRNRTSATGDEAVRGEGEPADVRGEGTAAPSPSSDASSR